MEEKTAEPRSDEKLKKKLRRSERSVRDYQYFLLRLIILMVLMWVLFFKLIGVIRMPTGDMYPRIDAGDLVMFYRLDTQPAPRTWWRSGARCPRSPASRRWCCG